MFASKERQRHKDGWPFDGVEFTHNLFADVTVRDVIQPSQGTGIVKYDVGHEFAVQFTVLAEHRGAKGVTERSPRGLAPFDDLASDHVRVNDGPTQRRQSFSNGRFTGADSARDSNSFHTSTVLIPTYIPGSPACT